MNLKPRKRFLRLIRSVHPRLGLRGSDVILASFPKSGNTWMRFIWANVVTELELGPRVVDFHSLHKEIGCDHDEYRYGQLRFECMPRLVKTHQLFSERTFGANRVLYIFRHPCDVMLSYHAFRAAKVRRSRVARMGFAEFIRDQKYGIPGWARHLKSWLPRATAVVSYEALKERPCQEMERVLTDLKIENVDAASIESAVAKSSFPNTRALEERFGRPHDRKFQQGFRFTRGGTSGDWKSQFAREDLDYVRSQIDCLGLAEWVTL